MTTVTVNKRLVLVITVSFAFLLFMFYFFPVFFSKIRDITNKWTNTYEGDDKRCGIDIFQSPDLAQDSEKIISYLNEFHIMPPSNKPYNIPKVEHPSEFQNIISKIFRNKYDGFFIEAGANDGEMLSNTLFLEMYQNWRGVLIEPNQFMLVKLRLKERKAWIADVCLSLQNSPHRVRFLHRNVPPSEFVWYMNGGGVVEGNSNLSGGTKTGDKDAFIFAGMAECFPLYSILKAINKTEIDYFSLDVEGVELKILKAIPWHLLTIKVISVEVNLVPEGEMALLDFLRSKKYFIAARQKFEVFAIHQDYLNEFDY